MCSILSAPQPDRRDSFIDKPGILPCAQMALAVDTARERIIIDSAAAAFQPCQQARANVFLSWCTEDPGQHLETCASPPKLIAHRGRTATESRKAPPNLAASSIWDGYELDRCHGSEAFVSNFGHARITITHYFHKENLERAKGFEPSTPTLARSCSTPELRSRPWVRSVYKKILGCFASQKG